VPPLCDRVTGDQVKMGGRKVRFS